MTPFWDIRFSGEVEIARQIILEAEGYIQNGSVAVLLLDNIPEINVSQLFNKFFDPAVWPSNVVDLSLTDSSIFYSTITAAPWPDGLPANVLEILQNQTSTGLFAASTATLELAGASLELDVTVEFDSATSDVTVEGDFLKALPVVDGDIVTLGSTTPVFGPAGNLTGFERGPSLTASSAGCSLSCGFTLFNHPFPITAELTVSAGGQGQPPSLSAVLTYTGSIGPISNPQLTLAWSESNGFSVGLPDLPFQNVIQDIESLLNQVSTAEGCGGLGQLAGQAITGDCSVTAHVTTTQPAGADPGQVWVVITGSFNVNAAGTQIASVNLPQLTLAFSISTQGAPGASGQFSWDSIGTDILNCLVSSAQQIVQELWSDKAQLATVIAVIGGEQALSGAASQLSEQVCDEVKQYLEDFADDFADALADYLGVDGVADVAAVVTLAGGVADLLDQTSGGSTPPLPGLPSPQNVGATFSASGGPNGTIVVSFDAVTGATGYQILATSVTGGKIATTTLLASTFTAALPVDPKLPVGACSIRVKALCNSSTSSNSLYSATAILKLAAPANVTAAYDPVADQVTVGWGAVTSATEYAVTISRATDNVTVVTVTFTPPVGNNATALSEALSTSTLAPLGTRNYQVAVQALAGTVSIPGSPVIAGSTLSRLPGPTSVVQSIPAAPAGLRVVWTPVTGASGFLLSVTAQLATPAVALNQRIPVPAPNANGTLQYDLLFTNFTVKDSGHYQVSVIALGDSTHLNSVAVPAATSDLLFSGIGSGRIGSTFIVG
jgi:hypothetical protein